MKKVLFSLFFIVAIAGCATFMSLYFKSLNLYNQIYTISFDTCGGNTLSDTKVKKGSTINEPTPSKENHEFLGWYNENTYLNKYDFSQPISSNFTLYAKWIRTYNIKFISEGNIIFEENIKENELLPKPKNPTRKGYLFKGWYEEENFLNEFNFSNEINDDKLLYANWQEIQGFCVTFDTCGGSEIENQEVAIASKVIEPPTPTRENYKFIGWFIGENYVQEYNFDSIVAGDITLYAKWVKLNTVNFVTNGGSQIENQIVEYGLTATKPNNPTKLGYKFFAWFEDIDCTKQFDFSCPITSNISLYADWVSAESYIVKFDLCDESEPQVQQVTPGEKVVPIFPTKDDYLLMGWYEDKEGTLKFNFDNIIEDDLILYAQWETKYVTISFSSTGDTTIDPITVERHSKLTQELPKPANRITSDFLYWSLNNQEFNQETTNIDENITLTGKWISLFNITYDFSRYEYTINGLSEYSKQNKTELSIPSTGYRNGIFTYKVANGAFKDCLNLVSVKIYGNSTVYSMFSGCTNLESVTLLPTITEIQSYTFQGCSKLSKINLNKNLAQIEYSAFSGCTSLTEFSFVDTKVTQIEQSTFSGCTSLSKLSFGEMITQIGYSAFRGCTALKEIYIGENIKQIEDYVFENCTSLSRITFENSDLTIGSEAFNNCTALTKIDISSIENWLKIAFDNSKSNPLYYAKKLYLNNELITNLIIPNSITLINNFAFYNCSELKTINFGNQITNIGESAFGSCSLLNTIKFGTNISTIGNSAFSNCLGLTRVEAPSLETWLQIKFSNISSNPVYYAFDLYINNSLLEDVLIPSAIQTINSFAFCGAKNLRTLTISNSVETIGESAFNDCSNLSIINFSNSLMTIHNGAFNSCSKLNTVNIDSLETWLKIEFKNETASPIRYSKKLTINGDDSYTEISIPENTTEIKKYAFSNFASITNFNIPNSVTSIGAAAFMGCSSLTSIELPETITIINGSTFSGCTALKSFTFSPSITTIGYTAFKNCKSIKTIYIPKTVTTISSMPFDFCSNLKIYCEYTSDRIPRGWSSEWKNGAKTAYYGYTYKQYLEEISK